MTPLQLKILLHHYVSPTPYKGDERTSMVKKIQEDFVQNELLYLRDDAIFQTTEKGEFFIKYILATPLPISTFAIPERENE